MRLVLPAATVLSTVLVAVIVWFHPSGPRSPSAAPPLPTRTVDLGTMPGLDASSATPWPTESPEPPSSTPTVLGGARPPHPAPSPPEAHFVAVAGESCPQSAVSGYYRQGWASDWYARPAGGWTGNGCAGRVVSVPMSGDRTVDDPDNVVVWWFRVPAGAECAVNVFVPDTGNALDAAGAPATYRVYPTTSATGTPIAQFTVDQVHNQGQWVGAATLHPTSDQLAVRLATRGIDWGPGRAGAHLGVSALQARC
jgi:hypothetical protein